MQSAKTGHKILHRRTKPGRQQQALRIAVALVPSCLDDVIPPRTLRTTTLVLCCMLNVSNAEHCCCCHAAYISSTIHRQQPSQAFLKKNAWLPPRSAAEDATLSCQRGGLVRYRNLQPVPLPLRNSDKCPTCRRQTERGQRDTTPSGTSTGNRCCEGSDAAMRCHAGTQGRAELKVHGIPGLLCAGAQRVSYY